VKIIITTRAEKPEINYGITSGANEYLTKPFQGDELLNMVAKYLEA
jgi:DNA-binding response OmpR family regulator